MTQSELPSIPQRSGKEKRATNHPSTALAASAVDAALDKKARDVVVMDLRGISGVADFFVLCTGDSDVQIKAIAESVRGDLRSKYKEKPWHVEGLDHLQWVLLDYVDVVVHVFAEGRRSFYELERLWGDAEIGTVSSEGSSADIPFLQSNVAQAVRRGD